MFFYLFSNKYNGFFLKFMKIVMYKRVKILVSSLSKSHLSKINL